MHPSAKFELCRTKKKHKTYGLTVHRLSCALEKIHASVDLIKHQTMQRVK